MEEFVQSSGEHGVVVFSLGSMVYNLTDEKSNVIARALSQLPQKVNLLSSIKQSALFFFFFLSLLFPSASLLRLISTWMSAGYAMAKKLGSAEADGWAASHHVQVFLSPPCPQTKWHGGVFIGKNIKIPLCGKPIITNWRYKSEPKLFESQGKGMRV